MSDEEWNPRMKRRLIKRKSDRKRRKVSSIRQQHNLFAHRARNLVWVLVWVWVADFFVFKSLDNNMVYSLRIDVYFCTERIVAQ